MSEYSRGWRESSQFDVDTFQAEINAHLNKHEQAFYHGYAGIRAGNFSSYGILNTPHALTTTAVGDFGIITNIVPSVVKLIQLHATLGNYGGIHLFLHTDQYLEVANTYYSDDREITPLSQILGMPQIDAVHQISTGYGTPGTLASIRMAGDAFNWIEAMDVEVREWTAPNGMITYFCPVSICAPMVRTDYHDNHNIVLMTGA